MSRGYVVVDTQKMFARRLVSPSKKLTISNAGPKISDIQIDTLLEKIPGFKSASSVNHLKSSFEKDRWKHVCTFRRTIWHNTEEQDDIIFPSFLEIPIPGTSQLQRVFSNTDQTITCFVCHKAKNCPSIQHSDTTQNESIAQISAEQNVLSQNILSIFEFEPFFLWRNKNSWSRGTFQNSSVMNQGHYPNQRVDGTLQSIAHTQHSHRPRWRKYSKLKIPSASLNTFKPQTLPLEINRRVSSLAAEQAW